MSDSLFPYLVQMGDNALILGQRLGEWCGHGPVLEQDIAITNIALDLMGQARSWFAYAAEVEGAGRNEDQLALTRLEHEYRNVLLVEHPNTDFAYTIVRQFLFDAYNYYLHEQLLHSSEPQVKAIATKSLKEITYHLRYSSEWMIRLGDGTDVSHQKMQMALDDLWMYSGELLQPSAVEQAAAVAGYGVDLTIIAPAVREKWQSIMQQATLTLPENAWMQSGGKTGQHTEHMGYLLTELQYMQRTYPNMEW